MGPDGTYCGEASAVESAEEEMRRRPLLASTSMVALGRVVQGLGELSELALPTGEPLPSQLGMVHVHTVEAVTGRLRGMARQFGGLADEVRDAYSIANAAFHAGMTLVRRGHPNDALKCFQMGQLVIAGFQPGKARPAVLRADDPRVPVLAGR